MLESRVFPGHEIGHSELMKPSRMTEVREMLKGLRSSIRRVRDDVGYDHDPTVTSRLWKAEMEIAQAENHLRNPATPDPNPDRG